MSETTLRTATLEDVPRLCEMFAEFHRSSVYEQYVGKNPDQVQRLIEALIGSTDGAIIVADHPVGGVIGMLAVMIFPNAMSGERIASEVFWWLNPDYRGHGVYLLRRAEKWALEHGVKKMTMVAPADKPRVEQIYETIGYHRMEVHFIKDLA